MTHDELVKFAAEKAGIEIEWRGKTPVYSLGLFTLTSPDLFFKGLAVCPHWVIFSKDEPVHGYYVRIRPDKSKAIDAGFVNIDEIPQKFWECWAEVEGKGDLTKED